MNTGFNTIIFDLDGTLADSAPDVGEGINRALGEMGYLPISMEQVKRAIGPGKEEFVKAVFPDGEDPDMERFIAFFRDYYWGHCLDRTRLFPGMDEVLVKLEDQRLAVASNKPRRYTEKILRGLGIRHRFSVVMGPEDVTQAKPHPEMIVKILESMEGKPSRTLFVGDTDKDMLAGRGAGVGLCGACYGYGASEDLERVKPDFLIQLPKELLKILHNSHI